jgi:hypothetical protein
MKRLTCLLLATLAFSLSARADTEISSLPAKPAPSPADYFPIIDSAAHDANPAAQNGRKLTLGQLSTFIGLIAGDVLPDMTGQAGNYLHTNGVIADWQPIPTGGGGTGIVDSEQAIAGSATTAWADGIHTLRASSALTANRTSNLPSAASFKKGELIVYIDAVTSATSAFGRTFTPIGSDTVNGGTAPYNPFIGGGTALFETDGVSAFTPLYTRATITGLQDPTDGTKQTVFDLSGIPTATTRTVKIAGDGNSVTVVPAIGATGEFATGLDAAGNLTFDTPSGAGLGTVTDFSAGDLSPLFTTTEATTTTTPALSFTLTPAAANTFFGNGTGSTAAPTFMSLSTAQTVLGIASNQRPTFANVFMTASTLTWGATTTISFNGNRFETVTLTGNTTFAQTTVAAGRVKTIRIICDGTGRTFTWPAGWIFVGSAAPASIAASKVALLTLTGFGTTDADVVAKYDVQP